MAMPDVRKKIRGIIGTILQLGISGVQIKNNASVIEARNSDDSDFVKMRCLAPVADNDVVTKYYADSLEKPLIVMRQADCTAALPANTGVRGWVVVTTAGTGTVLGDILYDDGSGAGNMAIIGKVEGRTIAVTDALAGGTIAFDPDSIYCWDEDGSVWVKIGDIGSVTGAARTIRFPITNAAQQDSTKTIVANARILECWLEITTPYSAGGTIIIGDSNDDDRFQVVGDNNPQANGVYSVDQDTAAHNTALACRVTVGGAPAAGVGVVIIKYCSPEA